MKHRYYIPLFAILLMILCIGRMSGQESVAPASSSGTEYLIAFPPSDQERSHQFMGILITSEFTTSGWIEIPDVPASDLEPITTFQTKPFSVRRGETTMIEIPRSLEPKYSDEASLRTVRLVSRAPVSVTVVNARQTASGGYPVRSLDRWGTTYLATALPAPAPSTTAITSQLLITAAEKGTVVTVYPSATTTFWQPGQKIQFTLDAKQTYLLQADASSGVQGSRDLSGTYISATKPIGVVAGHGRAALSGNPQEIFPTQTYSAWHGSMQTPESAEQWGTEYFSTAMQMDGDRFRVTARENSTTVKATLYNTAGNVVGEKSVVLDWRGQVVDVYAPEGMSLNGSVRWTSDKPFAITQLRLSNGDNSNPANSPAMVRLIPTSRYLSHSVFGLPTAIRGNRFSPFDLQMIAIGEGNPFENITIDGTKATDIPNVTIERIAGNTWRLRGTIPTGSHSIVASNGVTFTGNVSGNNGAIGGVSLAWELPEWVGDIDRDLTAPRVAQWNPVSTTTVDVLITDSTAQYFSGVETVELYNSPGWEQDPISLPTDPGVDVYATFTVKNGVDPSGPLSLRLRDYDGNESIIEVFKGICQMTAYPDPASRSVEFTVQDAAVQEKNVVLNANPCGDAAEISAIRFIPNGSANDHLEAPVINGGGLPYSVTANGSVAITLRTKGDRPIGTHTYTTVLEVTANGQTHQIPVTLKVERIPTSVHDKAEGTSALLAPAPNPAVGSTTLRFGKPLAREAQITIIDAQGRTVRSFTGESYAGAESIEWNGTNNSGTAVAPGVYFVTLNVGENSTTERVVLVR